MTKPDARMSASGESVESIRLARSEARWSWQTESPARMVRKNMDSKDGNSNLLSSEQRKQRNAAIHKLDSQQQLRHDCWSKQLSKNDHFGVVMQKVIFIDIVKNTQIDDH